MAYQNILAVLYSKNKLRNLLIDQKPRLTPMLYVIAKKKINNISKIKEKIRSIDSRTQTNFYILGINNRNMILKMFFLNLK